MAHLLRRFVSRVLPGANLGGGERAVASIDAAQVTAHALEELQAAKDALQRGEFAEALPLFQRVIDRGVIVNEGYYGWGISALKLGRADEAAIALNRAMDAKHPEAGLRLAERELAENRHLGAFEMYGRVLEIAPRLPEALFGRGVAARLLGRLEEAFAAFEHASTAVPPHPEATVRLSEMIFQRSLESVSIGHDAEAMVLLRRAVDSNPGFAEAGLRLADILLAEGDTAEASEIYQHILERNPGLPEAEFGRGVAALERGDVAAAEQAFEQALKKEGGYPAAAAAKAFLSLFPPTLAARPAKPERPLICVPVLPFVRGWLGGQIYLLNFARTISLLPPGKRPRLVALIAFDNWVENENLREMVASLSECTSVVGILDRTGAVVTSTPLLDRYLALKSRARGADGADTRDLLATVDWTFPVLYPSWGNTTVPRPLYWIPDFQHRFWPSYFTTAELVSRARDVKALASRNVPIVFSSRDAQMHYAKFYPDRRSRSHVWHFHTTPNAIPVPSDSTSFMALGLPPRFYYTPNQFWPHKNHETLFRSLRVLLDQGHDVTFVCTGSDLNSSADPYQRDLLALVDELQLGANLRLLGILPRETQFEVFRRACAIIQPSLFEGWSTVVEDARAFGRPLVVSDIPLHREQASEATFFSAQDPAALAAVIARIDATLNPGPDEQRERAAWDDVMTCARNSAEQFLAILASEESVPAETLSEPVPEICTGR